MTLMIDLIERRRADLDALCQKYGVRSLEIFGSAADGAFDPMSSDLDFLVTFLPLGPGQLFANYFDLWHDLRGLFNMKIDLLTADSIRNPYLAESVNRQRKVLYAA